MICRKILKISSRFASSCSSSYYYYYYLLLLLLPCYNYSANAAGDGDRVVAVVVLVTGVTEEIIVLVPKARGT